MNTTDTYNTYYYNTYVLNYMVTLLTRQVLTQYFYSQTFYAYGNPSYEVIIDPDLQMSTSLRLSCFVQTKQSQRIISDGYVNKMSPKTGSRSYYLSKGNFKVKKLQEMLIRQQKSLRYMPNCCHIIIQLWTKQTNTLGLTS